jgi:glutathione S-transferase
MYEVIGNVQSRAFRVLWMLEEISAPYLHLNVKPHSEAARAANPSGKVPALRVDGHCLTDSSAILTFLADRHGLLTHPAGSIERAEQDALLHLVLDEMDAVLWTAARHSFILPEDQRVPAVKPSLNWEFQRNAQRLSERLQGPFLMGDKMTVPDIVATHCLNWAFAAKFPVEDDKLLAYAKTMRGRDAFKRAAARV